MDQTLLIRFVLCYVMIAAIFARPLPSDKEKRHSGMRQMEDVQFSESELRRNGEESPSDQGGVRFYSSSGINLWRNGVIPYIFDRHFSTEHRKKAKKAMDEWSEHTCITFRRMKLSEIRDTNIVDFVRIHYGNVTNSRVGRIDHDNNVRGQYLNVREGQADIMRIYLHEFGHVIGLHHEHSRKDRDRYVKIYSENIIPGVGHNFDKINYYEKNTPYDYYSIMHYRIRDYAIDNSKLTIKILNPDNININEDSVGNRRRLSREDIAWVNKLYNCPTTVPPPVTPAPPKFYRQFKVKLARVPAVVPKDGYIFNAKEYLKCSNESCRVQVNEEPEFFITRLGNSTGSLQIGDKVLLSSHKSSVRQGEWILCDLLNCYSSQSCLNTSHNSSSGEVNFAINRPACKDHILTISSKLQKNGTIENYSRIVLEYRDNPRSQEEWMKCDAGGTCSRKECMRTNVTILGIETECKNQMDEFEAIYVS